MEAVARRSRSSSAHDAARAVARATGEEHQGAPTSEAKRETRVPALGSGEASVIVLDDVEGGEEDASLDDAPVAKRTRSRLGSRRSEEEEEEEGESNSPSLDSRASLVESESGGSESTTSSIPESFVSWTHSEHDSEEEGEGQDVRGDTRSTTPAAQEVPSASCVARRTRSRVGSEKPAGVSYTAYVEDVLDDSEEDDAEIDDMGDSDEEEDESYRQTTENADPNDTENTTRDRKGTNFNEEEKEEEFKVRRFSGINILVSHSKQRNEEEGRGRAGIARRTRSRFSSKPEKKRRKQLGTVSSPYCLDTDDPEAKSDSDTSSSDELEEEEDDNIDADESEEGKEQAGNSAKRKQVPTMKVPKAEELYKLLANTFLNQGNKLPEEFFTSSSDEEEEEDDDIDADESEEGKEQAGNSAKRKQVPRTKMPKAEELYKLLANTILNQGNKLPEQLFPPTKKASPHSCTEELPWIFSLGEDKSKPTEKSEEERLLDELWADFNFAMGASNMGSYPSDEDQAEDVMEVEVDTSTLCSQGKHDLIIDDQIGRICRFCSFVDLEIKHLLSPLGTRVVGERSGKKIFTTEEGQSVLNDLFTAGKGDGKQGSCQLPYGTVRDLIPGAYEDLYEHQREAFDFMWQNLAGSIHLDELKPHKLPDDAGGCVISHAPGTGKTRLGIIFIQTYMKVFPECRPVIVAPSGMLITWEKEFRKWNVDLPFHVLNSMEFSGGEDKIVLKLVEKEPRTKRWMRMVKLYSWIKGNSILGISYGLYQQLTLERSGKDKEVSKILLEKPGLFLLDEGHTPRNERSLIFKALEKIKTGQRIILSGTPFQNNFGELYNTLCLVRPKFAEKISAKRANICQKRKAHSVSGSVQNKLKGKWAHLTTKITEDSLEELRSMIRPFVHVYHGKILDQLPGLSDCVIFLEPLPQQKRILEKFEEFRENTSFENEYKMSLASIHPSLVTCCALTDKEESVVDKHLLESMRLNPNEGVKTRFVVELVRLCEALKEKVLVFCQHIAPLYIIKDQLLKLFNWAEGKEVLQMDGKISSKHRQSAIDIFNDLSSEARVLLASTKACCEGINLTGASRVVLLDVVWNPSVERQAVSRAYRIGQKKMVYTYHLISGKAEREKYGKQTRKEHLSKLVFSQGMGISSVKNSLAESEEGWFSKLVSEDRILKEMAGHDKIKNMFSEIYYTLKELPV